MMEMPYAAKSSTRKRFWQWASVGLADEWTSEKYFLNELVLTNSYW